jgi:hypothetical protein
MGQEHCNLLNSCAHSLSEILQYPSLIQEKESNGKYGRDNEQGRMPTAAP